MLYFSKYNWWFINVHMHRVHKTYILHFFFYIYISNLNHSLMTPLSELTCDWSLERGGDSGAEVTVQSGRGP